MKPLLIKDYTATSCIGRGTPAMLEALRHNPDVAVTLPGDKHALKRAVFDSKVDAEAFERSAT